MARFALEHDGLGEYLRRCDLSMNTTFDEAVEGGSSLVEKESFRDRVAGGEEGVELFEGANGGQLQSLSEEGRRGLERWLKPTCVPSASEITA